MPLDKSTVVLLLLSWLVELEADLVPPPLVRETADADRERNAGCVVSEEFI